MKIICNDRMELTEKPWQILQTPASATQKRPQAHRPPTHHQRVVLPGTNRLSVAKFAEAFSQVENG
jgi:hypothetical protein